MIAHWRLAPAGAGELARRTALTGLGLLGCAGGGVLVAWLGFPAIGVSIGLLAALAVWRYLKAPLIALATLVVYAGYVLFSRDFADLHVTTGPLPVYVGELLLLVTLPWALLRIDTRRVLGNPFFVALGVWMAFCMARLAFGGFEYGIDALRDSATWYYGLFTLVGYALWRAVPVVVWTRFFTVVFIALIGISIVALNSDALSLQYRVPREDILAASLIASANFFLLALRTARYTALRLLLSSLSLALLIPLEVRSATVGVILLLGVFVLQRRWRLLFSMVVIPAVAFGTLAVANVPLSGRVGGSTANELLERQLTLVTLLLDGRVVSNDPFLPRDATSGTALWRYNWWTALIDDALSSPEQALVGVGFGADIAWPLGIDQSQFDRPLRSPHNVAMTLFARTGIVGLAMWLTMLGIWMRMVWRAMGAASRAGSIAEGDYLLWMCAYVLMILAVALLGVVLEGPVGAVPFFLLLGMGARKAEELSTSTASSRSVSAQLLPKSRVGSVR
jgi:O-Antigen ligase